MGADETRASPRRNTRAGLPGRDGNGREERRHNSGDQRERLRERWLVRAYGGHLLSHQVCDPGGLLQDQRIADGAGERRDQQGPYSAEPRRRKAHRDLHAGENGRYRREKTRDRSDRDASQKFYPTVADAVYDALGRSVRERKLSRMSEEGAGARQLRRDEEEAGSAPETGQVHRRRSQLRD